MSDRPRAASQWPFTEPGWQPGAPGDAGAGMRVCTSPAGANKAAWYAPVLNAVTGGVVAYWAGANNCR